MNKYFNIKWLAAILLLLTGAYILSVSVGTKADYNPHPRLLVTPERLERIRTQHWQANSYEWQQLMAGTSRTDMAGARNKAFVYIVTGDQAQAQGALDILQQKMQAPLPPVTFNSVGRVFNEVACIYDWLYNYPGFTAEIKQQMIAWVNAVPETGSGKWNWYPNTVYMNGAAKPLMGVPLWGLATVGENPNADVYINNGYWNRWVYIRNAFGFTGPENQNIHRGGDQPKGWDYAAGYLHQITTYLDAVETATNVDLWDQAPALRETMGYFAKTFYYTEDAIRRAEHGHNAHKGSNYMTTTILGVRSLMDRYSSDTSAKWAKWWIDNTPGAQHMGTNSQLFGPEAVIYTDYSLVGQSPNNEPLALYTEGNGMLYSRSNWTSGGTQEPTTYTTFRAGNWTWFAQDHWDQGNFTLYSHGANLIVDAGVYEGSGGAPVRAYHHQSVAHNTLTIKDPLQSKGWDTFNWTTARPEYNSGGQNVPYRETLPNAILDGAPKDPSVPYSNPQILHDQSDITKQTYNNLYTYAFSDLTNAYANPGWTEAYSASRLQQVDFRPKVNNVTRQYYYLRPQPGSSEEFIVTYDRVQSTDASFEKANHLHFIGEPILDGDIINTEVAGHIETYDANSFTMNYGGATLHGQVVLPANAEIKKIGGYGYEYWVNGQNWPPFSNPDSPDNHEPEGGVWRMEIMPPTDQTYDIFFNVLHPDNEGQAAPAVTRISSAMHEGASFEGWVLMFSSQEAVRETASYNVAMSDNQHHLVADMEPGFTYNVYRNGQLLGTVSSGETGIVEFSATGGGSFQIAQGDYQEDSVPPTGTVSIQGGECLGSNQVVLNLTATDNNGGSGMAGGQMSFSNDGQNWSDPVAYQTTYTWTLASGEGEKQVYALFADAAGNWSAPPVSDTVNLDLTGPVTTFDIQETEIPLGSNVTLVVGAHDTGCAGSALTMSFSNNGSSYSNPVPLSSPTSWNLNAQTAGTYTVYARVRDTVGNATNVTDTVVVTSSNDDPQDDPNDDPNDDPQDDPQDDPDDDTPDLEVSMDKTQLDDTLVDSQYPDRNLGRKNVFQVLWGNTRKSPFLQKWDFTGVNPGSGYGVSSAILEVYNQNSGNGNNLTLQVFPLTREWVEGIETQDTPEAQDGGATWNEYNYTGNLSHAWSGYPNGPGIGDYDSNRMVQVTVSNSLGWKSIDITPIVNAWIRGDIPNYGLAFKLTSGGLYLRSSEHTSNTPKLSVSFTRSGGSDATAPDIILIAPGDDTENIPLDQIIKYNVIEYGSAVDMNSLSITLNGELMPIIKTQHESGQFAQARVVLVEPLLPDTAYTVRATAANVDDPDNMTIKEWSFRTVAQ